MISGTAKVEIDGAEKILQENQSSYIPLGCLHRLSNPGKIDLKVLKYKVGHI